MKSFLLSLLLILCFGFSTQAVDQLDQTSKIVKDLNTHFEFGLISTGQESLPKVKASTSPLISFHRPTVATHASSFFSDRNSILFSQSPSNFISSGASLVYHLSRSLS